MNPNGFAATPSGVNADRLVQRFRQLPRSHRSDQWVNARNTARRNDSVGWHTTRAEAQARIHDLRAGTPRRWWMPGWTCAPRRPGSGIRIHGSPWRCTRRRRARRIGSRRTGSRGSSRRRVRWALDGRPPGGDPRVGRTPADLPKRWSGCRDLNPGPQRPERCALTKLRHIPRTGDPSAARSRSLRVRRSPRDPGVSPRRTGRAGERRRSPPVTVPRPRAVPRPRRRRRARAAPGPAGAGSRDPPV